MAAYKRWRVDLDAGDVARKHVPDPPGFDSSSGRELVSTHHDYQDSQTSIVCGILDAELAQRHS